VTDGRGLHDDAVRVLTAWTPPDAGQAELRQEYLEFLAAEPGGMWRACRAGHLTGSALVVDPSRRQVLLTLHPKVGRWLQLGGHCEPGDRTMVAVALREAVEEGGIAGVRIDPEPLNLDLHPIECVRGIPNRHLDVQFLAIAPAGAEPVISDESLDLRWWPMDALPPGSDEVGIARLVQRAAARLETTHLGTTGLGTAARH
jgi:8-oxo-dGTP pyrophosphatase MutT (NUDIX family)